MVSHLHISVAKGALTASEWMRFAFSGNDILPEFQQQTGIYYLTNIDCLHSGKPILPCVNYMLYRSTWRDWGDA